MAVPGEQALAWRPKGVADTIEPANGKQGAMASLQNLIHDPATVGCFICRPANTLEIDFTVWAAAVPVGTATVITAAYQVGNVIYGLVSITTGVYAGLDYPFAFNHATGAFLPVVDADADIDVGDLPTSQATVGAWTPPQMCLTGVNLSVTHTGFAGGGVYFGNFNLLNPLAPIWFAGDTTTNSLGGVPQACGTFNNRTRFAIGNVVWYTDTLALAMTAANQSQTVGDYTNVTTLSPLPVSSSSNNIIQGLLAFKLTTVSLITGDPATPGGSNLALNQISPSVGTAAPRSVASTPDGVKFMADDGIRTINFFGILSEPDDDLAVPFINASIPSRVAAAFNADVYRICTQNAVVLGTPYQDYHYNFKRRAWSGPHTFRYDIAVPISNDFMLASNAILKKLWYSYTVQGHAGVGNTFIENGVALAFVYQTPTMSDLDNVYANTALRTTIELAAAAGGQQYLCTAINEDGAVLAQGTIMFAVNQALWGAFTWGAALWGAAQLGLKPLTIPWNAAVVFNKYAVSIQGACSLNVKLGAVHTAYKRLKYLLN